MNEHNTSGGGRSTDLKSVTRAIEALELISRTTAKGLTLAEITKELSVSRSSTWVLVQTLLRAEYLHEDGSDYPRRYSLGPAIMRLARSPLLEQSGGLIIRRHLQTLTDHTGFTSRFALLQEDDISIVARVDAPGAIRFNLHFGQPEQFHCTSVGKAVLASLNRDRVLDIILDRDLIRKTRNTITQIPDLLSDLETIRDRGYSIDDEEDFEGIVCIGSSVTDEHGAGIGAISVTALKQQLPNWRIESVGKSVASAAKLISSELLASSGFAQKDAAQWALEFDDQEQSK